MIVAGYDGGDDAVGESAIGDALREVKHRRPAAREKDCEAGWAVADDRALLGGHSRYDSMWVCV